jgi:hypothetical protein
MDRGKGVHRKGSSYKIPRYTGISQLEQEVGMLSKCVNPACSARFRYLHEGKVFRLEREHSDDVHSHSFEYFWLCVTCANLLTVVVEQGVVTVRPLHLKLPADASPLVPVEIRRPD